MRHGETTDISESAPSRGASARLAVPTLTILFHPYCERAGERALLTELVSGGTVHLSRITPRFAATVNEPGAPLGEPRLSRTPIRLVMMSGERIRLSVGDSRTVVVVDGEPAQAERDFSWADLERGVVLELSDRVVLAFHLSSGIRDEGVGAGGLLGMSDALVRVRSEIRRIAGLDVPVLIRGETGTGKEVVAQSIHAESPRRARPFVAVNMAAVQPSLAAAELFGAERGAFTGAVRAQAGHFVAAEGGTLFLDEIGDAPVDLQAMLLRALETREFHPLGSTKARSADVRIIAATDADLDAKIAVGTFRAPLLHRLAGFEIWLPPLRTRREDIGVLFVHFLRAALAGSGKPDRWSTPSESFVLSAVVARLARYDWPGNVRQLMNVVRQVVVSSRGGAALDAGPLLDRLLTAPRASQVGAPVAESTRDLARGETPTSWRTPGEVTDDELVAALIASRWDRKAAAQRLQISRTSLYARAERCPRVRKASEVSPEEITLAHQQCGGDIEGMIDRLGLSRRSLSRRIRECKLG
jgi:DNA-binding NtrC family response regulator